MLPGKFFLTACTKFSKVETELEVYEIFALIECLNVEDLIKTIDCPKLMHFEVALKCGSVIEVILLIIIKFMLSIFRCSCKMILR